MAQEKTILESIQDYLLTCPVVQGSQVYRDYLPDGEAYAVNTAGGEPIYKKYADGTKLKQFWFTVAVKVLDGRESEPTIDGIQSCQYLAEWFEEQSQKEILPAAEAVTPVRIETVKSGYLVSRETGYAQYQMQCRFIYFENE